MNRKTPTGGEGAARGDAGPTPTADRRRRNSANPWVNRRTFMLWFHWITAVLVLANFSIAWSREATHDLIARAFWLDVHRAIGLAILTLTVARLAGRLAVGPVSSGAQLPPFFWAASRLTHFLLYAGLLAMPLLGWAQSSARAHHFKLFGVPMPALIAHDPDRADLLGWWHEQVGWMLLALILLHAFAALYHHWVRHDDVLRAMLPRRHALDRAATPSG